MTGYMAIPEATGFVESDIVAARKHDRFIPPKRSRRGSDRSSAAKQSDTPRTSVRDRPLCLQQTTFFQVPAKRCQ
jgi:hypothetical protein